MKKIIKYIPRIVVAYVLLQTLWFKFGIGGQEALQESMMIFIHMSNAIFGHGDNEAIFRIGTGVIELIVSILIFTRLSFYGAILGIGVMAGAILSHLLILGVNVNHDAGQLMIMAIIVLLCCIKIAYDDRPLNYST